jgi:hypothetical protein
MILRGCSCSAAKSASTESLFDRGTSEPSTSTPLWSVSSLPHSPPRSSRKQFDFAEIIKRRAKAVGTVCTRVADGASVGHTSPVIQSESAKFSWNAESHASSPPLRSFRTTGLLSVGRISRLLATVALGHGHFSGHQSRPPTGMRCVARRTGSSVFAPSNKAPSLSLGERGERGDGRRLRK